MQFGIDNYGVGLGDLLVYSLFLVATYKAYGEKAARLAFGLILVMGAFVTAFIPFLLNFLDTEPTSGAVPGAVRPGGVLVLPLDEAPLRPGTDNGGLPGQRRRPGWSPRQGRAPASRG